MPTSIYLISGKVYDIYDIALPGATVTITHSNGSLEATTNSNGEYIVNLGSLSDWLQGDSLSIYATKTGEGTKTETTTILNSGGGQNQNITLAEEQVIDGEVTFPGRVITNKVIIESYDQRDINRSNRLPVSTGNAFEQYQPSDETATGETDYYGFVDRNGNWYILRYDINNGTFRYVKGSTGYTTNWTNRETLSYGYFHEVF